MNFEEYVKNIDIDKISVGKSDICFVLYFDTEKIDPENLGQLYEFACKKLRKERVFKWDVTRQKGPNF